MSLLDQTNT